MSSKFPRGGGAGPFLARSLSLLTKLFHSETAAGPQKRESERERERERADKRDAMKQ